MARFGNITDDDNKIYVLYVGDEPSPRAAYVAANSDQYDAFYDFVYSYCGSPLWDIIEGINYRRFMDETVAQLTSAEEYSDEDGFYGWDSNIVELRLPSEEAAAAEQGISILQVRQKAFDHLSQYAMWSYRTDAMLESRRQEVVNTMLELAK